jgi:pimeloyl-ACP methyl ester carboxylesterase
LVEHQLPKLRVAGSNPVVRLESLFAASAANVGTMPRLRRWAKRLGFALLGLFALLTIASVVYNAASAGAVKPATALYAGPFVHVDGKLVAYRRWGTRGTPIILLGGFIVPSSVWDEVGKRLGRAHRVFALDLPPFGYTERKGPYTLRGWTELVRAFETRFGLHHPVLVGHSLGAAVVVADALWHRADPKGIVLLDGDAISGGGAPSWLSNVLVGPWFTSIFRIATSSDWIFRRGLADAYPNHPSFTREFLEEWERPFKVRGTLDAFRAMLRYGIQGFQLTQLRSVRTPALVVWGALDTVDSVSAGRRSAQALRAPFRLVAGAGHLSMLSAPAAIARAVGAFARLRRPRAVRNRRCVPTPDGCLDRG